MTSITLDLPSLIRGCFDREVVGETREFLKTALKVGSLSIHSVLFVEWTFLKPEVIARRYRYAENQPWIAFHGTEDEFRNLGCECACGEAHTPAQGKVQKQQQALENRNFELHASDVFMAAPSKDSGWERFTDFLFEDLAKGVSELFEQAKDNMKVFSIKKLTVSVLDESGKEQSRLETNLSLFIDRVSEPI